MLKNRFPAATACTGSRASTGGGRSSSSFLVSRAAGALFSGSSALVDKSAGWQSDTQKNAGSTARLCSAGPLVSRQIGYRWWSTVTPRDLATGTQCPVFSERLERTLDFGAWWSREFGFAFQGACICRSRSNGRFLGLPRVTLLERQTNSQLTDEHLPVRAGDHLFSLEAPPAAVSALEGGAMSIFCHRHGGRA